jgi:aspartate racemase
MKNKCIGILAGMGPRSTGPFVDMVVTQCQIQYGAKYDEEFPHMLIYSLPTPLRLDRPLNHDLLKQVIIDGLQQLARNKVAFIAMPCNLAHMYYDDLSAAIDVPLLNMIEETVNEIPADTREVALIAARPTAAAGLYQRLGVSKSIDISITEARQEQIDALIKEVKTSSNHGSSNELLLDLVSALKTDGVDTLLMACTDLNTVTNTIRDEINFIDATESLAKAVVRNYVARRG